MTGKDLPVAQTALDRELGLWRWLVLPARTQRQRALLDPGRGLETPALALTCPCVSSSKCLPQLSSFLDL